MNILKTETQTQMQKAVDSLLHEFSRLRTGRAHVSLLDHITVACYGSGMPLNQVASVTVSDPRTLLITPWDKAMVQPVEKAIIDSDLGLNPATVGLAIRVPMPPLTEERRKELVKVVRGESESARVAVRNARRDTNQKVKHLVKDKEISEDEQHRIEADIQKLTDQFIAKIDELLKHKEQDLMQV